MIVIIFAQHAPVKSTRPAVRFVRSTNTEACSYSRVYCPRPLLPHRRALRRSERALRLWKKIRRHVGIRSSRDPRIETPKPRVEPPHVVLRDEQKQRELRVEALAHCFPPLRAGSGRVHLRWPFPWLGYDRANPALALVLGSLRARCNRSPHSRCARTQFAAAPRACTAVVHSSLEALVPCRRLRWRFN